jgi:WD40 repeat protein
VKALSTQPDNRVIAIANGKRRALVYNFSGRFPRVSLQAADPDAGPFNTICFNDITFDVAGDVVITSHTYEELVGSIIGKTEVRRADDGTQIVSIPHGGFGVAFSGDRKLLAVRDIHRKVSIWGLDDEKLGDIRHTMVTALAFSPVREEAILATAGDDAHARVWDAGSGQQVLQCAHPDTVTAVAFSPDAAWLATGCTDGKARIWSEAGAQMLEFPHNGVVNAVAFSRDGRWLASAGQDNAAKIWNVATGQLKVTCSHTAPVTALAFGSDSETWLATGSHDGSVRIWRIPST